MSASRATLAAISCLAILTCAKDEPVDDVAPATPAAPIEPLRVEGRLPMEWLSVFADSGGRDLTALWKAKDGGDRSSEFERKLLALHGEIHDPLGFEAVDAFLDVRRIPHDCPSIPAYAPQSFSPDGSNFPIPSFAYAWPLPLLDGTDDGLVATLDSADVVERTRAALSLLVRRRHVDIVVALLVKRIHRETQGSWSGKWGGDTGWVGKDSVIPRSSLDAYALIFAKHFLGSGFDDVVLQMVSDTGDDAAFRRFLVKQVGFSGRSDSSAMLIALEPWIADGGATTREVLKWTLRGTGYRNEYADSFGNRMESEWLSPYRYAVDSRFKRPEVEAGYGARAARAAAGSLEELLHSDRLEVSDLRMIVLPVTLEDTFRESCQPVLLQITESTADLADEAMRLLAVSGADDPRVRSAYFARVSKLVEAGQLEFGWQATLVHHDDATIECLENAIRRAKAPEAMAAALPCIRDPSPSVASRVESLKRLVVDAAAKPAGWRWLFEANWPNDPSQLQDSDPCNRVYKLGVALRVCRARGGDDRELVERFAHVLDDVPDPQGNFGPVDPYTAWWIVADELDVTHPAMTTFALRHLARIEGFHNDEIASILDRGTLDKEQARSLASLAPLFVDSHQIARVLEDQEHGLFEVIPRVWGEFTDSLFREPFCQRFVLDLDRLDRVVRSGAFSRRAREWLVLALDQGLARERERALRIVEERGVDDIEVLVAVERRRDDPDRAVRELATRVLTR